MTNTAETQKIKNMADIIAMSAKLKPEFQAYVLGSLNLLLATQNCSEDKKEKKGA